MRVAVFSSKEYERGFLDEAAEELGHELVHVEAALTAQTAALAAGCEVASVFVGDDGSAEVLAALAALGVRGLALRSAGFNHVDLDAAARLGLRVTRVPAYSPHAIAEHAIALMLTLNRKLHRAYNRVREQNFSLGGLMGFDMHGKTAGVVGTGEIGEVVCRLLTGFGCEVLASDPKPNPACAQMGVTYVGLDELLERSHVVTLHCPLNPATHHLIGARELGLMRPDVMLVNTSRGAVVDTLALIDALKSRRVGSVALDVYEEEGDLFFRDLSDTVIDDDVFVRLMTFPNVLITAHQGFFTREAVGAIARTTVENVDAIARGEVVEAREVTLALVAG
jgi:D-lactate dehydrogenase